MNDERLAEIRKRLNAATPGPWKAYYSEYEVVTNGGEFVCSVAKCDCDEGDEDEEDDIDAVFDRIAVLSNQAAFIAHARTDIPDLLSEVERLKVELLALREQTRWIPVSEKLPEAGTFVDVSVGGVLQNHTAHYYEGDWYWCDPEADPAPREVVSHWRARPLPPAPVPVEQEVKP
jgi:hypothetical protein